MIVIVRGGYGAVIVIVAPITLPKNIPFSKQTDIDRLQVDASRFGFHVSEGEGSSRHSSSILYRPYIHVVFQSVIHY